LRDRVKLWIRTDDPEYDARVKAMEVDERPTETYTDIGGLDKQIEELVEAM
jgi:26S proteasome regulatory subunit T5